MQLRGKLVLFLAVTLGMAALNHAHRQPWGQGSHTPLSTFRKTTARAEPAKIPKVGGSSGKWGGKMWCAPINVCVPRRVGLLPRPRGRVP
eukprot:scaffold84442_cov72-Phaeocystis_antarctica.AAC.1